MTREGAEHGLVRFAEKLLNLLGQGGFTATYKYAVLIALMDLCLERSATDGAPPTAVTTEQLAQKVIELYWMQSGQFAEATTARGGRELRQNANREAKVLTLIRAFRGATNDPTQSLHRARLARPQDWRKLVREVQWVLVKMPLPKLQRVGGSTDAFIYQIDWNDSVTQRSFRAGSNLVRFVPGAAEHLVALSGMIRPLVHREWAAMVSRLNDLGDRDLERFLFGADRVTLEPVRAPLLDLQHGACFYCTCPIRSAEVDHSLPWSRHADDGIDNLVAACSTCNGHKSDFLGEANHVFKWARRAVEQATTLGQIAIDRRWPRDVSRTVSVVRAVYRHLPSDVRLWRLGSEFVAIESDVIDDAIGVMKGVA